jgi:hypothetical protein
MHGVLIHIHTVTFMTAGIAKAGAAYFSFPHSVQGGSGAHLASYLKGTGGCFIGIKAAGA